MKKSLKRLVIDSATKFLYIELFEGFESKGYYHFEGHNDHSLYLMSEIEKLMNNANYLPTDLDEIIVGVGPGSYTGLRIGVTVAKMFAWNNKIPVYEVSSLALLASSSDVLGLVLPEIDARRGNSFLGVYSVTEDSVVEIKNDELRNLEDFIVSYDKQLHKVSMGKPDFNKVLNSNLLNECQDVHQLAPNYMRITEAERNKQ